MIDFQELKRTYDAVASAIGKAQEPMEELNVLRRFLAELCANDGALLGPASGEPAEGAEGLPADEIRYILEDMGPGLIKKMCRERSGDEQVSIFRLTAGWPSNHVFSFLVPRGMRWRTGGILESLFDRTEEKTLPCGVPTGVSADV